MKQYRSGWGIALLLSAGVGLAHANGGGEQDDKDKKKDDSKVTIFFKVFDANEPKTDPITPSPTAILSLRNQETKKAKYFGAVAIEKVKDGDHKDFWQVKVNKGELIEHLVINLEGARYSPADLIKIVTRADMVLYPGTSSSVDKFSITAFMSQLNNYRAIITDLIAEFPDQREAIRLALGAAYRTQLTNLAEAAEIRESQLNLPEDDKRIRLATTDRKEIAAALRLADEVLKLYGLRPADAPSPGSEKKEDLKLDTCNEYIPCPCPRRGLFGRKAY